ncbi:MAG: PEP/pyruvate-binding domain-containing protein [Nitrospira sp.]
MIPSLILSLQESRDPSLVGGKAAGLSRLLAAGFAVPQGLCVTTTVYTHALAAGGINAEAVWRRILQASQEERSQELSRVHACLRKQAWPTGFQLALEARLAGLTYDSATRWAVRSSATNEDVEQASAAGLYRTSLGLSSSEILRGICDCWQSLWSEPAVEYALRTSSPRSCPSMAVVIQPLLQATTAGVAYSMHPVTGRTSQVVINAVPGLASSLVSGEVTPDQYVVEVAEDEGRPLRVRRRLLATKQQQWLSTPAGVHAETISESAQKLSSLSDAQLFQLAELSKQIEAAFRQPIDLEWVWDADKVWVVQARPITAVQPSSALTNDECEWTRANLKETMPELPSPLGLSFLERFMDDYIVAAYRRLGCTVPEGLSCVRVMHGRPYLNVTLFYTLVTQLHGNPSFLTEQMGGEALGFTPSVRPLGGLALVRAGLLMMREWRRVVREGPANFAAMKHIARTYETGRIRSLSAMEVAATLDRLGQWLDAHEVTFGILGGVAQSLQAMGTFLPGWLGEDWRELLNASLQGQGSVISATHILRLAELAEVASRESVVQQWFLSEWWAASGFREALAGTRFLRRFEEYLADYGHRAVGESDIMSPRIADQPDSVLILLQTQLRAGKAVPPGDVMAQQAQRRQAALAEIHRRFGWRRHRGVVFRWWYRRLSRFCALREANRHHLLYYSTAVRHLLLQAGERMVEEGILTQRDDMFYLTMEEQAALSEGAARDWQGLVRQRREQRTRDKEVRVPDTIRDWDAVLEQGTSMTGQVAGGLLRGIAVSAGTTTGPVRIVRSTADWKRVRPGDILVVPVIDPGMAPLFGLAAGLVAEMGGTLSHGAIIAREYGLPVLVNVPYATTLLREDEQVQIVSSTGTISRLVP